MLVKDPCHCHCMLREMVEFVVKTVELGAHLVSVPCHMLHEIVNFVVPSEECTHFCTDVRTDGCVEV